MIKLQGDEVIYNNIENLGKFMNMTFMNNGFLIRTSNDEVIFIPEEGSNSFEKAVFSAYHEYYKDTGGVKPIQSSLEQIKIDHIKTLSDACRNDILNGFNYTRDGITYLLGFDQEDQSNLSQKLTIISAKTILNPDYRPIITWKVKGKLEFIDFTKEEFINNICSLAEIHKENKMQRYYRLSAQVHECETEEQIKAITW